LKLPYPPEVPNSGLVEVEPSALTRCELRPLKVKFSAPPAALEMPAPGAAEGGQASSWTTLHSPKERDEKMPRIPRINRQAILMLPIIFCNSFGGLKSANFTRNG
jgi:hypothetical protein